MLITVPVVNASGLEGHASRMVSVSERAQMKLVGHHLGKLEEEGRQVGTVNCTVRSIVDVSYTNATLHFQTCSGKNTFNGNGSSSFYVSGRKGYFKGTLHVSGGSGKYAHASGNLLMTGTFERGTYALNLVLSGKVSV